MLTPKIKKYCSTLLFLTFPLAAISTSSEWFGQSLPSEIPSRFAAVLLKNSADNSGLIELHGSPQYSQNKKIMLIEFQTYDKQT